MKTIAGRKCAFTLVEVMVMFAIVAILAAVAVPRMIKSKQIAKRISCVGRLKNIGLAFRIFATDNNNLFPMGKFTNWTFSATNVVGYFQTLSNELSTPILVTCPAGRERKPSKNFQSLTARNISYFIGFDAAETKPQSLLAGDRNLAGEPITNGVIRLTKNSTNLYWTWKQHQNQGNVTLGDGSVMQTSSKRLQQIIADFNEPQRLLLPE